MSNRDAEMKQLSKEEIDTLLASFKIIVELINKVAEDIYILKIQTSSLYGKLDKQFEPEETIEEQAHHALIEREFFGDEKEEELCANVYCKFHESGCYRNCAKWFPGKLAKLCEDYKNEEPEIVHGPLGNCSCADCNDNNKL